MQLSSRRKLYEYFTPHFPNGVIAEVGVFRGENAKVMHSVIQPREFHLIDPWGHVEDTGYGDHVKGSTQTPAKWENMYKANKEHWDKVSGATVHRMLSKDAVKLFKDGHFDLVYLDGNHKYEFIKEDLIIWKDKIGVGGYIAGHDYDQDGVKQAVSEVFPDNYVIGTKDFPSSFIVML